MQTTPALRLTDVTRRYGVGDAAVVALDRATLSIDPGEFVAIMGPSGSGKSTLMHLAAGLDAPTSGSVRIGDAELVGLDDAALTRLRRDRVGFVFQAFNLVPTLSARDNIRLPFDLAGRRADEALIDMLVTWLGLSGRVDHRPGELSGGQQQRVAIARALATRPAIVFADEPTGNLDSRTAADVLAILQQAAREHGQAICMVTHDAIAAEAADRVVLLADGRIRGDERGLDRAGIAERMLRLQERAA